MPLVSKTFSEIITFTRATSATYFDATGTLQTATSGTPRFDYDPSTLAPRGFLIEEQRTNLFFSSAALQITTQLAVTGGSGSFTDGETVTATGGGSGVYVAGESTAGTFSISGGAGTFSGTLTGGTSGATRTISSAAARWGVTRSSVSANAVNSPAGTLTADKVVEDTATGTHFCSQTVSGTTNTNAYTAVVFVKAAGRTIFNLYVVEGTTFTRAVDCNFDLSAGTAAAVTTAGGATGSATITAINGGWYRCAVVATLGGSDTAIQVRLRLADGAGNASYTGDGTSGLFIWGAQLEAGAFPTSYIPTTTATVTRNADAASVNTLSPWYNASAGTLYTESVLARQNALAGNATANIATGVTSEIKLFYRGSGATGAAVTDLSVTQADLSPTGVVTANTTVKMALAYSVNDFAASGNGGAVVTDTSGTVPAVNIMTLGNTGFMNGWLRRVTYYPRRLTNTELQTLTT